MGQSTKIAKKVQKLNHDYDEIIPVVCMNFLNFIRDLDICTRHTIQTQTINKLKDNGNEDYIKDIHFGNHKHNLILYGIIQNRL